ncbi:MAG: hypothetical protein COB78_07140 [Hyphomicrobiales bacterium]|nr:MAG: hypothetical protein COB78_07140 [Hyphomicrobiales bacterium]
MNTESSPKRPINQRIVHWLLGIMINEEFVHFANLSTGNKLSKPYIIHAPSLGITIRMFLNPTYWIPEAYCRGHWNLEKGDLSDFIEHITDNVRGSYRRYFEFQQSRPTFLHILKQKLFHRYFTRKVKKHYNLNSEIYAKFLDSEMVYTCAFFEEGDSLADAQDRKFSTILKRIEGQREGLKVLNIGSGWGSFERFSVRNNNTLHVTGLSISLPQIQWTKEHNRKALTAGELERVNLTCPLKTPPL